MSKRANPTAIGAFVVGALVLAVAGVEPFASKLKARPDEHVSMFEPGEINIVVVGGETQGAWRMIGGSYRDATVSVDAWR